MTYQIKNRDEHYLSPGSKRILAIDGGGLRGVFTIELLQKIEDILRARHGEGFRLAHYFDLMAGTSTGSVIASCLALGMTVSQVRDHYEALGREVFKRDWLRWGIARPKYDKNRMIAALKTIFGADTEMGSERIQTGLLIMTKRRDRGSPWPISNNPSGKYFGGNEQNTHIPNANYPLWSVARASTAAPAFFKGETIEIAAQDGKPAVSGEFVDGGVSPFNNPSLQAFMYATLEGYRVKWPMGPDKILLVSLGTGSRDPSIKNQFFEAHNAIKSMIGMMDDCNDLVQTMLQWMSASPNGKSFDREIGDLSNDHIGSGPSLSYMRYNMELTGEGVRRELGIDLVGKDVKRLAKLDAQENMPLWSEIGTKAADKLIKESHFPAVFDLPDTQAE